MGENNNGRQNMLGSDAHGGQVLSKRTYGFGEEGELAIFVNINFILKL